MTFSINLNNYGISTHRFKPTLKVFVFLQPRMISAIVIKATNNVKHAKITVNSIIRERDTWATEENGIFESFIRHLDAVFELFDPILLIFVQWLHFDTA